MSIGRSEFRKDAVGKVTGEAHYPGDLPAENCLHAKLLFSGKPHARMISMDTSQAEALPGVVAVFTAKDVPVNEYGLTMNDQPVLVGLNDMGRSDVPADISRWEGDQVAIVVAESDEIAAQALELINIEWETLPIVTDVQVAMGDEIILHPQKGTNIYAQLKIQKGDMDNGWAEADVIVEGEYESPYQEHAFLQPEAAVSYMDDAGRVTVQVAGQWAHEDQAQIAHALDLPAEQVRVVYPAIGGAFGGREDISLQIVMALATLKLHERGETRPIRSVWSREESIVGHHKRHKAIVKTKWGATNAGEITAVEATVIMDAGAYNYTSNKVLGNFHLSVGGPYEIPNAKIDSFAVHTNNVPGGAFRGFGAPQGAWVAENQMNKLAVKLGMDPVEIRLLNCLQEGSEGVFMEKMPAGVSLPQVIEQCAENAGWQSEIANRKSQIVNRKSKITNPFSPFQSLPSNPKAIKRGRGFACAYKNVGFSFGFPERCEATIELHGEGEIERVVLHHAGAEVGQGAHTAFRQMTAEAVGVTVGKIELIVSDTADTGDSGSVSASRMTWMAGNAIIEAAEKALAQWTDEDRPAIGHARFTPRPTTTLDPVTGKGDPNITMGYVAQAVEVAVDVESGHIMVERVICADDVGKAINPKLIEGQIEGAVVQAHGYTLTENLQVRDGHILNPRLSTYLIPGILDIPERVASVILEYPDPQGPWGARGMAEMPMIPLAPAISAALYDAVGVWFDKFPLTPGRVVAGVKSNNWLVD